MSPLIRPDTALIIIDLQNDFLSEDGAYAGGGAVLPAARTLPARVAPVAQALKRAGGMVAASQFTLWPDAAGEPMVSAHLKQLRPFLRRGDFQAGAAGHDTVAALRPWVDVAVWKVAYSAFFETQLDWVLRRAGIGSVVLAGIVTNGGVASTVRDAHMRDYHVTVLSDGCAAFSTAAHEAALADMSSVADILSCEDYLRRLEAA